MLLRVIAWTIFCTSLSLLFKHIALSREHESYLTALFAAAMASGYLFGAVATVHALRKDPFDKE